MCPALTNRYRRAGHPGARPKTVPGRPGGDRHVPRWRAYDRVRESKSRMTRRGILISADGLDRAGTTRLLDALGRWLERRGRRVETLSAAPSVVVRRAAGSQRMRPFLDARVAALLSAAELERSTLPAIDAGLRRGSVVLVDRYAWTATARAVARGLDPGWVRRLHAFLPRPELTVYLRLPANRALKETLAAVPSDGALGAAAAAYGPFLERVVTEFDALASAAGGADAEPWPTAAVVVEARHPDKAAAGVRETLKPLLSARPLQQSNGRPPSQPSRRGAGAGRAQVGLPAAGPPGHGEPGRLIVLEGIDHAGRSTHAALLERYLRNTGHGVVRTSFGESAIAGEVLREAKRERGWDATAMVLLYAADLAERIEHVMRPALRAGLTVIADRYAYTPAARAVARGAAADWVESMFEFAPRPDLVLLLDLPASLAIARGRQDPAQKAESLDSAQANDYRDFQAGVARWFATARGRLGFVRVDASRDLNLVQASIRRSVASSDGSTREAAAL